MTGSVLGNVEVENLIPTDPFLLFFFFAKIPLLPALFKEMSFWYQFCFKMLPAIYNAMSILQGFYCKYIILCITVTILCFVSMQFITLLGMSPIGEKQAK